MKSISQLALLAGVATVGLCANSAAQADTFTLTSCHVTGGCTGTSFGTVTLTANTTGGVFVDVALSDSIRFVETGSGDQQLFKFNNTASGATAANITNPVTGMPTGATTLIGTSGSFSGDGTGNFSFGIACTTDCMGSSGPVFQEITFTVTNTTLANLETSNNLGNIFVADVLFPSTGNTGPIDVSVPGPIVGAGLPGLVMACGGLLALARRRRQKTA